MDMQQQNDDSKLYETPVSNREHQHGETALGQTLTVIGRQVESRILVPNKVSWGTC